MKFMKIILLINSLGAGGAERSTFELAKFLKKQRGISVKFLCLERRQVGIEEEVENEEIDTIFYEGKNSWISKTRFVSKVLKSETPDIIHSVLADSNLILRFSNFLNTSGKIVQSLVSTPYSEERRKDRQLPWYKFRLVKMTDRLSARFSGNIFFHAITEEVLEHHRNLYNIKDNYAIIHRGRRPNVYHDVVPKNEVFTVINVGRHEFAKGQIVLLKAMALIKERYPAVNIHVEILGRDGNCSSQLIDFIKKNDLKKEVSLVGFTRDVDIRLAKAHVFAFPSYYEGLGGALIEAFSAGLPCICSDIPSLREVVKEKDAALFLAPGDHEKLAEQILLLYNNNGLRKEMGQKVRKRFEESFQLDDINRKMLQMYKKILSQ